MPIRNQDPFHDPTEGLNPHVNPYVRHIVAHSKDFKTPILYGPSLKDVRGHWQEQFPSSTPSQVIVEIGSHKGKVLCSMAQDFPDKGFVGFDITFKRVVETAKKAESSNLENLISVLANAKRLDLLFEPNEVDGIIIFFPDPWAKKARQTKNRLIDEEYVKHIVSILKPGGFFWFKTDHQEYAENTAEWARIHGLLPTEPTKTDILGHQYQSRFEAGFQEKNMPTFEHKWIKSPTR